MVTIIILTVGRYPLPDWCKAYVYNGQSVRCGNHFNVSSFNSLSQFLLYSKLTHHCQLEMSLNAAAGISAVLGVPLTAAPVGFTIHNALQSLRPYSKLKKWTIRVQHISAAVAAVGDIITPEELESFLLVLELLVKSRYSKAILISKILQLYGCKGFIPSKY